MADEKEKETAIEVDDANPPDNPGAVEIIPDGAKLDKPIVQVREEGKAAEKDDDKGGDDDDERLAHDDETEGGERRPRYDRESRAARRARQQKARERERAEIDALKNTVQQLAGALQSVQRGTVGNQLATIEQNISQASAYYNQVNAELAKAIEAGDGTRSAALLAERDKASHAANQWAGAKNALIQQANAQPQPQTRPAPEVVKPADAIDEDVARDHYEDFRERHKWFDPDGADKDSRLLKALDDQLPRDGLKPDSPKYWKELEKRIAEHIPHRMRTNGANANGNGDARRALPPTGAARESGSNGRTVYTISAIQRAYLDQAGIGDDALSQASNEDERKSILTRRNKIVKQWASAGRQSA